MSWLSLIVLSPVLALVPLNLYGQYYLVTHVPPGYPSARAVQRSAEPMPVEQERRWLDLNETSIWKPERWGLHRRGRALSGRRDPSGRTDKGDAVRGMAGEAKRVRRCRKCDGPKPEVSYWRAISPGWTAERSARTTAASAGAAC
jgi:palmitoyltransferase